MLKRQTSRPFRASSLLRIVTQGVAGKAGFALGCRIMPFQGKESNQLSPAWPPA
jgi:hypothetical protein